MTLDVHLELLHSLDGVGRVHLRLQLFEHACLDLIFDDADQGHLGAEVSIEVEFGGNVDVEEAGLRGSVDQAFPHACHLS